MRLFRNRPGPHDLAVSMTGAQMGDRVLVLRCGDGGFLARLASRVGLSGRAAGVDPSEEARQRAARAAARAGALIELVDAPYTRLPYEADSFDIVVAHDLLGRLRPEERVTCLREVWRVLRPGGRCLVIEPASRGGLWDLVASRSRDPYYLVAGGAVAALQAEGFRGVRTLAEREGRRFVEGAKPRG
jgi:ubiquinone/menaquinone biosynthesis C-methylase UbiE